MAYIGPAPNPGQNREVDAISSGVNGSEVNFTLQVNSQNVSPGSSNSIVVSVGGVVQNPGTDYTVAASTLTFTTAPASGLSFFGLVLGQQVDTQSLADGTSPTMSAPTITGDLSIADKIVHTGDTDTAIRFSAADTVSVETGGSQKLSLGAATVFNESGADVDFRIEGDTDTNLFNLDASADAIGIGAAPITTGPKFEVTRSTTDAFVNATDCTARLINSDTSANTNQTSLQFTTKTTSTGADSAIVSQAEDASGNSRLEFWTDTSNGMTEKASIDSTGDLTIADGDLVIGTDGHGIDFSAQTAASNAYTKDSELLDHYEEGTFTPSVSSPQLNSCQLPAFTDASYTQRNGNYIKIGRLVMFVIEIQMASSTTFANGDGSQVNAIRGAFPFNRATGSRPISSPCGIRFSGSTYTDHRIYADARNDFSPPFVRVTESEGSGLGTLTISEAFPTSAHVQISGFYLADA